METPSNPSPLDPAELYLRTREPFLRPAWDLLEDLALRPGERVLLVPAREERLLDLLLSFHREGPLKVQEFHPHLARRARTLVKNRREEERVEVLEAPLHLVPAPGSQDALLAHFLLPTIPDPSAFAKALGRNLRPGGRFALQVPVEGFCPPLEEALMDTLASRRDLPDPEEVRTPLDPIEFFLAVTESGFRQVEETEKVYLEKFATAMEAADFLFASGGWGGLEDLEPEQREEAAREVRLRLAKALKRDQEIELPFRRLLISGKR